MKLGILTVLVINAVMVDYGNICCAYRYLIDASRGAIAWALQREKIFPSWELF